MNKAATIAILCVLVAGCAPVPDSGNVVYLEPLSSEQRAAREAELQGQPVAASSTSASGEPLDARVSTVAVAPTPVDPSNLSNDTTYTGQPTAAATTKPVGPYEVVAPTPVPQRPSDSGPSVVAYALETSHPVGQTVYTRNDASTDRSARACARYASADLAQAAFLAAGGPQSDSRGLDPDGDGYACAWNPEPFRKAIR